MKRSAELSNLDLEYFHGLTIPPLSESGGGAPPQLQEKSILITQNGNSRVTPDQGYDGLYLVSLNTQVPERLPEMNLNTTILQNTTTTLLPAPGYVLTSLQITTRVPANTTTLSTNLQYLQQVFRPTGFDGYSQVQITCGVLIDKISVKDKHFNELKLINTYDFQQWSSPDILPDSSNRMYVVIYDYYNELYIEKNGTDPQDMYGPMHYCDISDVSWEDIGGLELKDSSDNVLFTIQGQLTTNSDDPEREDTRWHLGISLGRPFRFPFGPY